jgi:hypothetical protein
MERHELGLVEVLRISVRQSSLHSSPQVLFNSDSQILPKDYDGSVGDVGKQGSGGIKE